ncbi:MAG: 4-hydroxy-tetrahydrodipicolinate reductase [Bacteroidetes bacterium]|nr:4-hydroxy-tetrahydrodipicolinate reductase [Bacteroidota bacterium]
MTSDPLHIAIAGTGRMGKAVEATAKKRGHSIVGRFNRLNPVTLKTLNASNPDVIIDFTGPQVAVTHMRLYSMSNTSAVIGTTGWYDHLKEVMNVFNANSSGLVYGSNFSLGIQLLFQALNTLAPLLDQLTEFDITLHESHHSAKLDSPSGTAIDLANAILGKLQRKKRWSLPTVPYDASTLEVTSTRLGHVFGQHRVLIDGPSDYLVFEHTAKNRDGFAMGAVLAAEWIQGRKGFYSVEEMMDHWVKHHLNS